MQRPPSRTSLRRAFGKTVRAIRQRAGLSQESLALESGIGRGYMGGIERGQHTPTIETLYRLLPALKVTVGEFFQEFERNLRR